MGDVSGEGLLRDDLLRLLVAVEVADLIRVPLPVQVLDAVVAVVDHLFGDLTLEAPAGFFADVVFPAAVAFLPLAPGVDAVHLADNAVDDAESVASIVSSGAILDHPPAGGRLVQLLGRDRRVPQIWNLDQEGWLGDFRCWWGIKEADRDIYGHAPSGGCGLTGDEVGETIQAQKLDCGRLDVERSTLGHSKSQQLVSNFEASCSDGADAVELVCDMFIVEGVLGVGKNSVAFALADVKDPSVTGI